MFPENSRLPGFHVALFDKDADALASLLHGDDRGSFHPFGNRIGIGVDREFRRAFAEFADGDDVRSLEDRGSLAFGLERQERRNDQMRRRMRKHRSSGRGVVSGGSRRGDDEESVAAEADAGMPADFDVERNEMPSGGFYLGFVEGLAFGRERLGIEAHVEERGFEFQEFGIRTG